MDSNQKTTYKQALLDEKKLLEKELGELGVINNHEGTGSKDWIAKADDMDVMAADENEVADEMESFQNNQAMVGSLEERYHEVEQALAAFENNTYGVCKVCGAQISEDRLSANKAALTCSSCMNG